jgi:hypothetical protein
LQVDGRFAAQRDDRRVRVRLAEVAGAVVDEYRDRVADDGEVDALVAAESAGRHAERARCRELLRVQRERAVFIREDAGAVAVQGEHVRARVEVEVANEQSVRERRAELRGDEQLAIRARVIQHDERARHAG